MTDEINNHANLRSLIEAHFNLDELRDLCATLGVDYDQLGEGLPKSGRVLALVDYLVRRGRLPDLINACRALRPNVTWPHVPGPSETPCPYKGLYAFQEEDAHLFFGRDEAAQQVIAAVTQRSLTAVIGPSGSGKSSLVSAGVLPKLPEWIIVKFRPGNQPFYNLAAALVGQLEPAMADIDRLLETRKLAEALQNNTLPLTDVITRLVTKALPKTQLLLVADQFEELYTLVSEEETRRCFLNTLLSLNSSLSKGEGGGKRPQGEGKEHTHLILTLRADFLGQVLGYRLVADALQGNTIMLGPMNRAELRQAIVEPADVAKVTFEEHLVERILDDIAPADSQPEPGDLPLLEFALTQLWEQQHDGYLTHVAYEAIGQVRGALARHAETVFAGLTAEEQAQLPQVMVQLVHPGAGAAETRRLASRHDLGEVGWRLTQKLAEADARLVVTNRDETAGQETA